MIIKVKNSDKISINSSGDLYKIMQLILTRDSKIDNSKEHFWTVALNEANKIVVIELVSFGSYHSTASEPTEVFSIPLQKKVARIILIHNHPSGNLQPSEADIDMTDRLYQVGKWMRTEVIDHLIISPYSYYSFKDSGIMDRYFLSSKYLPSFELERRYEKYAEDIQKEAEKQKKMLAKDMKQEGIKIGEEKGIKKGSRERELAIARGMLKEGETVDKIMRYTGLPKVTINKLFKEL